MSTKRKSNEEAGTSSTSKRGAPVQSKLFKDPIHDYIEVHGAALLIIDTPQFQRLRHIKQLSTVHYVYPGANGTRFDHSLGVYHLAGKLVRCLKDKQPELGLNRRRLSLCGVGRALP
ncbi:SAMHD1 [Bugula neritina]|uniref:SAMHD1 n=1 Tax=Bugula neritina TaxID=10212 RepID=A0A7J7J4Y9_BUGNE|nr:SAMHD1 [Bugula neritina]